MDITKEEKQLQEDDIEYVKKNKQELIAEFILSKKVFPMPIISVFMAGSPGVGKTEYVNGYEKEWNEKFNKIKQEAKVKKAFNINEYENFFVRIDIDQIREFIPQYQKTDREKKTQGNAHIIQPAANIALDILRNYCIKQQLSFLLDGTFGNQFSTFDKMIKKLIRQERIIIIYFIYTNPVIAWKFTKKREHLEGRNITKENFIKQYFKSIDNVRRIKQKFNKEIILNFVLKNDKNKKERVYFNKSYEEVEKILKSCYNVDKFTEEYLNKILK